jgi:uncharacterized damage-inducible protein DinB
VKLLSGNRPQPAFKWQDRPSLTEVADYAARVGDALQEAARHISAAQTIYQEWDGKPTSYRALALFIQIVNHGVEHRTNITTILNQMQQTPPDVDGWSYMWSHPDRFDVK